MTRLVIFDLDGTLLDTIDDLAASTNYALRRNGYPEHELAAYRYFVGNGVAKLIERALPEAERSAQNVERLRRDFVEYYTEHSADLTKPYPGIRETVSELGRRGIVRAVASNKYQAATEKLVAHFFGEETFRVVLGQREGIAPRNPTRRSCAIFFRGRASLPPKRSMLVIRASICRRRATAVCARSA